MVVSLPDVLGSIPMFAGLDRSDLAHLAGVSTTRQYPAGGFLTRSGEEWPCLFLVVEGELNVLKESSEGRSLVIATLQKGEIFWGLAFFQEGVPNPMSVQVTKPSTLCLWMREQLLPYLRTNGALSWELSRVLIQRMLHASQVLDGLAFQPVRGRLARLLLEYPGRSDSGPTARSLTLDDMAARIGSTREIVCRFLQKFADEGLISITRTDFEITNRAGLAGLAQKEKV